jgi:type II secretion system protein I
MSNPAGDAGFTLIEILVALAIFAVSGAALLSIVSTSLDRGDNTSKRTIASLHLQSLLAEAGSTIPLQGGHGSFDDGMAWQIRITPYRESVRSKAPLQEVVVEARVSWKDGDRVEGRSLQTLRLVPVMP